jgi:pyruvate dehydrogenase E2 component (dihydrolipoamide acetyltransferase)
MKYIVPMPSLGADMEEGKLMSWKISPGDSVKKGQSIAIVETTKSAVEIESFYDGVVLELLGHQGDSIHVGTAIASFEIAEQVIPTTDVKKRIMISPAARKLAIENNVNLESVSGHGPEGLIELADVEKFIQIHGPVKSSVNIRVAIAKAMSDSKKEIPHYYLKHTFSLDVVMKWLDEKNRTLPPDERLLMPTILIKAIVNALKDFPMFNGYFKAGGYVSSEVINVGVAVALKSGGVLVPAVLDAQNLSLDQLNSSFLDLAHRVQLNELKNRELTEGTFTITNLGDSGCEEVFGIIFPPQVALIGLGFIHKRLVMLNDKVVNSWAVVGSLSADHRVSDGLVGAKFLRKIDEFLQIPEQLLEAYEKR